MATHFPSGGTLYVVATPIGNLEDITFRAVRTLKEVDLIAAEDTRRTAHLLARYEIRKRVIALHAHNENRALAKLIGQLQQGESIALVSDAGTPGISDPGAQFVAAARSAGIRVVPIPGPSAVAAALSIAGLPADQFVFAGFPPRSGTARALWLDRVAKEVLPVVAFEAPHRIRQTVKDLIELGKTPIMCARELTKMHEELVVSSNYVGLPEQGEYTIVLPPTSERAPEPEEVAQAVDYFEYLTNVRNVDRQIALDLVARLTKTPARELKKAAKQRRFPPQSTAP